MLSGQVLSPSQPHYTLNGNQIHKLKIMMHICQISKTTGKEFQFSFQSLPSMLLAILVSNSVKKTFKTIVKVM